MKVLISGGGTAGHINPALSVADYLAKEHGAEILFLGTKKGLENQLVPKAGWSIRYIEVSGLIRKLSLKNIIIVKQFIMAIRSSKKIMKEFKPDIAIGTGGYVCAPVLFAAHALKIPTLVHEQNVIPGVTVKMASKIADKICISFLDTTKYLKPACRTKCLVTGNPIRSKMLSVNQQEARKRLGLDERPFIVSFGGSLGAAQLNHAVTEMINTCDMSRFQFMLGTGQRYYEKVKEKIKKTDDSIKIVPYIEQMDIVMAAADLVIGRAGALTVSELCAMGKPAILIPSPNVAHDHQTHNAKSMEKAGGAVMIPEKELCEKQLYKAIIKIVENPSLLEKMAKKAKEAGIMDGDKRIAEAAVSLLKK